MAETICVGDVMVVRLRDTGLYTTLDTREISMCQVVWWIARAAETVVSRGRYRWWTFLIYQISFS